MTVTRIAGFDVGEGHPLLLICGPDIVEDEAMTLRAALAVQALARKHGVPLVFKCSVDKANRTSLRSFRGPGLEEGLRILARVKEQTGLAVLIDAHEPAQVPAIAAVADVVQVPAFLCRQTDLLVACAQSGRAVNIKKGQFVAPWDMRHPLAKIRESGNPHVLLTERGSCFGYNNLVVDMRSLVTLRSLGAPVCFDATHSVQLPSAGGDASSGERHHVRPLARAAVAAGVDALFLEVHENPSKARCDGPNSLDFTELDRLLAEVTALRQALGQA
jgi:2-dehydro-3-deoxyphosphooctonate aldolase (KDO 8-P synthase)